MERAVSEEAAIATETPEADTTPGLKEAGRRDNGSGSEEPAFVAGIADGSADAAVPESVHDSLLSIIGQYSQYVALFVGAGLISGSVVHFPLAPTRYAVIGSVGALIFAVASVLSEWSSKDVPRLVRVAISSLALALGIGMISGSIQHFQDIPDRAARLIPLGLALSAAAFLVRNRLRPRKEDLAVITAWIVIVAAFLALTLSQVAQRIGEPSEAHGHETATEAAPSESVESADTKPADTDASASARSEAKPANATATPSNDAHDHEH